MNNMNKLSMNKTPCMNCTDVFVVLFVFINLISLLAQAKLDKGSLWQRCNDGELDPIYHPSRSQSSSDQDNATPGTLSPGLEGKTTGFPLVTTGLQMSKFSLLLLFCLVCLFVFFFLLCEIIQLLDTDKGIL